MAGGEGETPDGVHETGDAAQAQKPCSWNFFRCVRSDRRDTNQAAVAMVAAVISFFLVFGVILAMGFVDYQGRLTTPGVRTSDVIGSVDIEARIDVALPALLNAGVEYRKVARELQQKQADVNFRIERVCSRFDAMYGGATPVIATTATPESGRPEASTPAVTASAADRGSPTPADRCRRFLLRIPFDGTLGASSLPRAEGSALEQKQSEGRDIFDEAIIKSFLEEMGLNKTATGNNYGSYLYKSDFINIAEINHELFTQIYPELEARRDAYIDQCTYIITLVAQVGYQRYTMPSCNMSPTAEKNAPNLNSARGSAASASGSGGVGPAAPMSGPLQGESKKAPDTNQLLYDMVSQFRIYENIPFNLSRIILLSSPETVAQLLLVIGGALGAMLKILFWHLLPARNIKWSDLVIEPAQGCACAIILFILFRSGVVVVSGGGDKIDGSTLSPFFVAFIAIGAGLLSDEVITAFRRAAQGIIGNSAVRQPDRWAVGLDAAFAASAAQGLPVSIETLASRLGILPERVRDWIDGDATVDAENQAKVALVLGVPTYRIFTDIRPTTKLNPSDGAQQPTPDAAAPVPPDPAGDI